jgi:hypothetical protein
MGRASGEEISIPETLSSGKNHFEKINRRKGMILPFFLRFSVFCH